MCGYLKHNHTSVYLEFGYWSDAEKRPKKANAYNYSSGIYVGVAWKPWKTDNSLYFYDPPLRSFPDEELFQRELRKRLKRTKAAVLRKKRCPKDVNKSSGSLKFLKQHLVAASEQAGKEISNYDALFDCGLISFTDAGEMACTRFRRHRVRCFYGTGGESWRDVGLRESSSLKLCG